MAGSLVEVVAGVLKMPPEEVDDTSAPATVGQWTSLAHLQLVSAVEDAFQVSFTPREIRGITCVGDIRDHLVRRGVQA